MERMEQAVQVSYDEFVQALIEGCNQGVTFCVFVTTSDNASGRIIISNGEIIALGYANKKGNKAIAAMQSIERIKYRVGKLRLNISPDTSLPSTDIILSQLSGAPSDSGAAPAPKVGSLISSQQRKAIESSLVDVIGPMAEFFIEDNIDLNASYEKIVRQVMKNLSSEEAEAFKQSLDANT